MPVHRLLRCRSHFRPRRFGMLGHGNSHWQARPLHCGLSAVSYSSHLSGDQLPLVVLRFVRALTPIRPSRWSSMLVAAMKAAILPSWPSGTMISILDSSRTAWSTRDSQVRVKFRGSSCWVNGPLKSFWHWTNWCSSIRFCGLKLSVAIALASTQVPWWTQHTMDLIRWLKSSWQRRLSSFPVSASCSSRTQWCCKWFFGCPNLLSKFFLVGVNMFQCSDIRIRTSNNLRIVA